eukprot:1017074-Amphidinium_carterae.1
MLSRHCFYHVARHGALCRRCYREDLTSGLDMMSLIDRAPLPRGHSASVARPASSMVTWTLDECGCNSMLDNCSPCICQHWNKWVNIHDV